MRRKQIYFVSAATTMLLATFTICESKGDRATTLTSAPPTPCCFPLSFQATVVDMRSVASSNIQMFEVFRDWDRRLQVQRVLEFVPPGQTTPVTTIIMDFNKPVQYIITASGDCQSGPLEYAMLEPCMPDNAKYLGQTYIGFGHNSANFQAWSFRRTNEGRNITMTVAVTPDECVPVMETITGTLGQARTDSLILFTTLQAVQDWTPFEVPPSCPDV